MRDQETKNRFIELRAQGYSFQRISEELQVSKPTLIDWSKEFQLEVKNARAIEMEALQEKCLALKEHQIRLFGEILQKVKVELDKRDFSLLNTGQLIDAMLKLSKVLRDESIITVFTREEEFHEINLKERNTWAP